MMKRVAAHVSIDYFVTHPGIPCRRSHKLHAKVSLLMAKITRVEPDACGPAHRHLMSAPRNGFPVRHGEGPRVVHYWDFIKRHPDRLHEFR